MHFIRYIDKLKDEMITYIKVINKTDFCFYQEIKLIDISINNKIICLKKQYSNILIKTQQGIKVYLDDYDIVSILIYLIYKHEKIGQAIIDSMYEMIKGKKTPFLFKIKEEKFNYNGLPVINNDFLINTKTDIEISVNEFIAVLNLIFAKEEINKEQNVVKNIICKYICLVEYYANQNSESKKILDELNFSTSNSLKRNKNIIAKAGDYKFVVDINTFLKYKQI